MMAAAPSAVTALKRIADGQVMSGEFTHAQTVLAYQNLAREALAEFGIAIALEAQGISQARPQSRREFHQERAADLRRRAAELKATGDEAGEEHAHELETEAAQIEHDLALDSMEEGR